MKSTGIQTALSPRVVTERAARATHNFLLLAPGVLCLVLVSSLWMALVRHYHVPNVQVSDQSVEQARRVPSEATFAELRQLHSIEPYLESDAQAVPLADALLKGEAVLPKGERLSLAIAQAPERSNEAPELSQLAVASMDPVAILTAAYLASRKRVYLDRATDIILAYDAWDRNAWLPVGLAWNDHAVAARVQALTDFWGVYRHDPAYDPQRGKRILELVARSGERLSASRFFTVGTNHGVMQNLSLLEVAIAFPSLPEAAGYRDLAMQRLGRQMDFYVSNEGAILEHSAFYHHFGLRLLTVMTRMIALLNERIPDDWNDKFRAAQEFHAQLQRPDGTLPQFGDTFAEPVSFDKAVLSPAPLRFPPSASRAMYPISGYSVSWSALAHWPDARRMSQTVIAWSNFPSRAHKHADDMSVLVWAGGQSWWTNVGYWPYDDAARGAAQSWEGSNAPHAIGESYANAVPAQLLGTGAVQGISIVDLQRTGLGGLSLRRQVVELQPGTWVVIDSSSGRVDKQVMTSWTADHEVNVRDEGGNCYRLMSGRIPDSMQTCLMAGAGFSSRWMRASTRPFAGWQVLGHTPVPANTLVVEQPAGSWMLNTFRWNSTNRERPLAPVMTAWRDAEHWALDVDSATTVVRDGQSIRTTADSKITEVAISVDPAIDSADQQIRRAYFSAAHEYPKFEDAVSTRKKLGWLLIAALVGSYAALVLIRRIFTRYVRMASLMLTLLWIGGAIAVALSFRALFLS